MNYKKFLEKASELLADYYDTISDNTQYTAIWQIAELYGRIQVYLDLEEDNDEQTKADTDEHL